MRITGGQYRGRLIDAPKDQRIRPTTDKNRQAIFNVLMHSGHDMEGRIVLDLFCGTGAMGLEALSHGAARCFFIDQDMDSLNLARKNALGLGVPQYSFFIKQDALHFQAPEGFDLVFIDPPYKKSLVTPAIMHLIKQSLLNEGAVLVVECEKEASLPSHPSLSLWQEKLYGESRIGFFVYSQDVK